MGGFANRFLLELLLKPDIESIWSLYSLNEELGIVSLSFNGTRSCYCIEFLFFFFESYYCELILDRVLSPSFWSTKLRYIESLFGLFFSEDFCLINNSDGLFFRDKAYCFFNNFRLFFVGEFFSEDVFCFFKGDDPLLFVDFFAEAWYSSLNSFYR